MAISLTHLFFIHVTYAVPVSHVRGETAGTTYILPAI